jgi:caffeic acid 3-O-methyltransferase
MGKNQRLGALFDHAMAQHSVILVSKMLERFQGFDGVQQLVDVGGGDGSTLGMITSRYKHIRGINYDLPHVISQAPSLPGMCDRDFVLTTSIDQFARRTNLYYYKN